MSADDSLTATLALPDTPTASDGAMPDAAPAKKPRARKKVTPTAEESAGSSEMATPANDEAPEPRRTSARTVRTTRSRARTAATGDGDSRIPNESGPRQTSVPEPGPFQAIDDFVSEMSATQERQVDVRQPDVDLDDQTPRTHRTDDSDDSNRGGISDSAESSASGDEPRLRPLRRSGSSALDALLAGGSFEAPIRSEAEGDMSERSTADDGADRDGAPAHSDDTPRPDIRNLDRTIDHGLRRPADSRLTDRAGRILGDRRPGSDGARPVDFVTERDQRQFRTDRPGYSRAPQGRHENDNSVRRDRFDQRGGNRSVRNDREMNVNRDNGFVASADRRHDNGQGKRTTGPQPVAPAPTSVRQATPPQITITDLDERAIDELIAQATEMGIANASRMKRPEVQLRILRAQTELDGGVFGDGILEIIEDGFGFLRSQRFLPSPDDIYVSQSQIRRFGLRTGDRVSGQVRPPKDNEKFFSLLRVEAVNGVDAEVARKRPSFDGLTPIFPLELINLETAPNVLSTRLLNLIAPIGRGQRGLIVSPPKAGKTMLLKSIANGITANNPDMHLMVCLIGERPEEVTDMRRSIEGEVISSTFDEPVEDHTKVAEMALERAKRLVEAGRDVTILLDSITRLARAYNLAVPPSGRTLSGGMDPVALYPPKRFFGAARNIEGGGSLTVVSTCLIDTGSRMDDVIYEEFKGTGNMELHLDRKLAERRIYPAIDIQRSGTRREELLLDDHTLKQVWTMRRMVSMLGGSEGTELVLSRLSKTTTNAEFLETLNKDL